MPLTNLDSLIGTDVPIGGRLVMSRVKSSGGAIYRTKCIGFDGNPCGFETNVAGRVLRAGKCGRCVSCTQKMRAARTTHTPVGAEFVAARRRHAKMPA